MKVILKNPWTRILHLKLHQEMQEEREQLTNQPEVHGQ